MTKIAKAVRALEAAENDAGRNGHTDEAHARILAATEAVRVAAEPRQWTLYDACACVEGFDNIEHDADDIKSAWQYLIDTGACWSLQGWYGRCARDMIEAGHCHPAEAA